MLLHPLPVGCFALGFLYSSFSLLQSCPIDIFYSSSVIHQYSHRDSILFITSNGTEVSKDLPVCAHPALYVTEADDRDMGCVVSSLVQVMCDPHCRTQRGFQGLVQKEWVMAGHRFSSRINYHRDNDKEEVRGPVGRPGTSRQMLEHVGSVFHIVVYLIYCIFECN